MISQHQQAVFTAACIMAILVLPQTGQGQMIGPGNYDSLVPSGKETDAIYGDYAIGNERLKAVVANPLLTRKANMTVREVGGCLIDLACTSLESDQLSCFYPGQNQFPFTQRQAVDGGVKVISPGTASRPQCEVIYRPMPEQPVVEIISRWTNTTEQPWQVVLKDDVRIDSNNERIQRLTSDQPEMFSISDLFWQQSYAIRAPGYQISSRNDRRTSAVQYIPVDGQLPKLPPGESFEFRRLLIVGANLLDVKATVDQMAGRQVIERTLKVVDADQTPIANANVRLLSDGKLRGIARANAQGEIEVLLPNESFEIKAEVAGIELTGAKTIQLNDQVTDVSWRATNYRQGVLSATVVDGQGKAIPAKVELIGNGSTPSPNWGPDSGEFFVRNLAYTANGTFVVPLQVGQYNVIVSHGPEFNAVFTRVDIKPGETTELKSTLEHVVDTSGWISADFHSHSSPSGDNTGSQLGRVLNLAAENIDFAPCTEHNRISTYDQHIESLNLKSFLATVSGMELTGSPLPLNHQNVFPLIRKPRTQDGGGPQTDADPEQQIERATIWDERSEKLVQQNHPDIGWLFYDKNGDGQPDEGYSRSFRLMDVMEVHPIDPILELTPYQMKDGKPSGNQPMFNWLQLLNQGHRIYGVVNTDAHYNFHGSGWLRNWIQSNTDQPEQIEPLDVVRASEQGRLVMSNGPFLEASFSSADQPERVLVAGQDLVARDGKVDVHIRVQCPNWFDVDRVMVLINGQPSPDHQFTRQSHPEMFGDKVIKFDRKLEIELNEDSHLIVVTGHATNRLGDVFGPAGGAQYPAALTNPVFVDVDGDGFQPNRNSLGHPLPVKFGANRN